MSTWPEVALLGESPRILEIAKLVTKLARTRVPVMLLGESGTGKDVVARAIHTANPVGPFVPIDCTALTGTLIESELFGHVRGAFTGAIAAKAGLIEMADGGTAFFDEVGDIPLELQVKLLRLLQRKEYRPVGSLTMKRADFRIISATNRELAELVEHGLFRRDLYYRLNVVCLHLPPLRERKEDIGPLARHFLAGFGPQYRLGPGVLDELRAYDWPGNVRELEHCIAAMVAMTSTPQLDKSILPPVLRIAGEQGHRPLEDKGAVIEPERGMRAGSRVLSLAEVEKEHIIRALESTHWDCAAAARTLRIGRTTLYRKIKGYRLERRLKAQAASSASQ